MVGGQPSEAAEDVEGLFALFAADEVAGRLHLEEGEDHEDARKHDVNGGRHSLFQECISDHRAQRQSNSPVLQVPAQELADVPSGYSSPGYEARYRRRKSTPA